MGLLGQISEGVLGHPIQTLDRFYSSHSPPVVGHETQTPLRNQWAEFQSFWTGPRFVKKNLKQSPQSEKQVEPSPLSPYLAGMTAASKNRR